MTSNNALFLLLEEPRLATALSLAWYVATRGLHGLNNLTTCRCLLDTAQVSTCGVTNERCQVIGPCRNCKRCSYCIGFASPWKPLMLTRYC